MLAAECVTDPSLCCRRCPLRCVARRCGPRRPRSPAIGQPARPRRCRRSSLAGGGAHLPQSSGPRCPRRRVPSPVGGETEAAPGRREGTGGCAGLSAVGCSKARQSGARPKAPEHGCVGDRVGRHPLVEHRLSGRSAACIVAEYGASAWSGRSMPRRRAYTLRGGSACIAVAATCCDM